VVRTQANPRVNNITVEKEVIPTFDKLFNDSSGRNARHGALDLTPNVSSTGI